MSDYHRMLAPRSASRSRTGTSPDPRHAHASPADATRDKAATVRSQATVLGAWEPSTSVHTWGNPTTWDVQIMTVLAGWGYQPSDVE